MTVSGKLWAELAHVALNDAHALEDIAREGSRSARKEALRLRVLSKRFAYRGREAGFVEQGSSYVFGETPQAYKTCGCGRLFDLLDWLSLRRLGKLHGHTLRNCDHCGSTLAMKEPA